MKVCGSSTRFGLRVLIWSVLGAAIFKHVFCVKETLVPLTLTEDEILDHVEGTLPLISKDDNTGNHERLIQDAFATTDNNGQPHDFETFYVSTPMVEDINLRNSRSYSNYWFEKMCKPYALMHLPNTVKRCILESLKASSLRNRFPPGIDASSQDLLSVEHTQNERSRYNVPSKKIIDQSFERAQKRSKDSRYDKSQLFRKELNAMVLKNAADSETTKMPLFGPNYYKRHDLYSGKKARNDSVVSYDPTFWNLSKDTPRIKHLQPSWLATALVNLGRHLGTLSEENRSSSDRSGVRTSPIRANIVTDRDTIMRLNFRHVLRGA